MSYTLLLADDSLTIRRVIELTFAEEDLTVTAVADGRRAIACLASLQPDIVLADVGMSTPGGYEIAAFVKGTPELAHIPVVLLTAAFQPIDEARARAAGCDAVLAKPFELPLLVSRVKELLAAAAARRSRSAEGSGAVDEAAGEAGEPALGGDGVVSASADESREAAGVLPAEAVPDPSLDDRLDRIDAALAPTANGTRKAAAAAVEASLAALPAWDSTWMSEAEGNRLSLDDYFDLVDAAARKEGAMANGVKPATSGTRPDGEGQALRAEDSNEAGDEGGRGAEDSKKTDHQAAPGTEDQGVTGTEAPKEATGKPAPRAEGRAQRRGAGSESARGRRRKKGEASAASSQDVQVADSENPDPAEPLDAVTRTFLALLESTAGPSSPDVVERAVRRLLAGTNTER